jgi:hypothetical protein
LPGRPRRLTDKTESAAVDDIGGQAEVHDIENIEELRAEFQSPEFSVATMSKRRIFDDREIEIVIGRTPEGVSSQGPKTPLVGTRAPGNVDRNVEEGSVAGSQAKLICTNGATGRQLGHGNKIGPIASA